MGLPLRLFSLLRRAGLARVGTAKLGLGSAALGPAALVGSCRRRSCPRGAALLRMASWDAGPLPMDAIATQRVAEAGRWKDGRVTAPQAPYLSGLVTIISGR